MPLLQSFDDAFLASTSQASSSSTCNSKRRIVGGTLPKTTADIDWDILTQTNLKSHSDGLTSTVYRRALTPISCWPYHHTSSSASSSAATDPLTRAIASADGLPGWLCIKRTAPDEQPKPHSISLELALHDLLPPHPNIAPLLAAIYDTTNPFGSTLDLIMPLYAATLEEVFQEPTLLPPSLSTSSTYSERRIEPRPGSSIKHLWVGKFEEFVNSVTIQLLEGVGFLHENGVAHRDIKPSNILLSPNGCLKLIDLGTAYTKQILKDPLGEEGNNATLGGDEEENNGGGGGRMVCQVGTGEFRAPELLFAPKKGYDAMKVDIWSVGVVLCPFFTQLVASPAATGGGGGVPMEEEDERMDWEKAFDSAKPLPLPHEEDEDLYWEESDLYPPHSPSSTQPRTASGFIRTPLFESNKGEISLAGSIFSLLGLPTTTQEWPEAEDFQPPLCRLPFAATLGKGLLEGLPLYKALQEKNEALESVVQGVIKGALQLSASKRPSASALLTRMTPTSSSTCLAPPAEKGVPASLKTPYPPLERPPKPKRPLHVVLTSTGSVASVKIPLIVEALLAYQNVRIMVVATDNSLHFYDRETISKLNAQHSCNPHASSTEYTVADLAAENRSASQGTLHNTPPSTTMPRVWLWTKLDEWSSFRTIGDPILHIELRRWADLTIVAPTSANTLAKLAAGLCDDLLTSYMRALGPEQRVVLCPAMNTLMWQHPLTERHLEVVKGVLGYEVWGPVEKVLACGDAGVGAMVGWEAVVQRVVDRFGLVKANNDEELEKGGVRLAKNMGSLGGGCG